MVSVAAAHTAMRTARRFARSPAARSYAQRSASRLPRHVMAAGATAAALSGSPLKRLMAFYSSKETFFKFWVEVIGAIISGLFLIGASTLKLGK